MKKNKDCLKTRAFWKWCYLELDGFEEDKEGGAGVVLHVIVQTERLQTIGNHFKLIKRLC